MNDDNTRRALEIVELALEAGERVALDPERATAKDIELALGALGAVALAVAPVLALLAGRAMAATAHGVEPEEVTVDEALRAARNPDSFTASAIDTGEEQKAAIINRAAVLALLPTLRPLLPPTVADELEKALKALDRGVVRGLATPGPKTLPGKDGEVYGRPDLRWNMAVVVAAEVAFQQAALSCSRSRAITAATGVADPRLARSRKVKPAIDFAGGALSWKQVQDMITIGERDEAMMELARRVGSKLGAGQALNQDEAQWFAQREAMLAELNKRLRDDATGRTFTVAVHRLRQSRGG